MLCVVIKLILQATLLICFCFAMNSWYEVCQCCHCVVYTGKQARQTREADSTLLHKMEKIINLSILFRSNEKEWASQLLNTTSLASILIFIAYFSYIYMFSVSTFYIINYSILGHMWTGPGLNNSTKSFNNWRHHWKHLRLDFLGTTACLSSYTASSIEGEFWESICQL